MPLPQLYASLLGKDTAAEALLRKNKNTVKFKAVGPTPLSVSRVRRPSRAPAPSITRRRVRKPELPITDHKGTISERADASVQQIRDALQQSSSLTQSHNIPLRTVKSPLSPADRLATSMEALTVAPQPPKICLKCLVRPAVRAEGCGHIYVKQDSGNFQCVRSGRCADCGTSFLIWKVLRTQKDFLAFQSGRSCIQCYAEHLLRNAKYESVQFYRVESQEWNQAEIDEVLAGAMREVALEQEKEASEFVRVTCPKLVADLQSL